ncbi:unnamed protein product [Somion occarium]|uniref:Uncharacterized protein n=1 Tax=Somion occarium TaxID=3059160 RepID=A0ABP1DXR9_9APHY
MNHRCRLDDCQSCFVGLSASYEIVRSQAVACAKTLDVSSAVVLECCLRGDCFHLHSTVMVQLRRLAEQGSQGGQAEAMDQLVSMSDTHTTRANMGQWHRRLTFHGEYSLFAATVEKAPGEYRA